MRPRDKELQPLAAKILDALVWGHNAGTSLRTSALALRLHTTHKEVYEALKELRRRELVETCYPHCWGWKPTQRGLLFHRGEVTL